jgi:hypothetical protein
VCCTYGKGEPLFSHEELADSFHNDGKTLILSFCLLRGLIICCAMLVRRIVSTSVLLALSADSAVFSVSIEIKLRAERPRIRDSFIGWGKRFFFRNHWSTQ